MKEDLGRKGSVASLQVGEFVENFDRLSVPILTMEGRIIYHLSTNGQSRIKEIMLASGGSYRGFYLAMNRLIDKGIVIVSNDPSDKRARLAALNGWRDLAQHSSRD